MDDLEFKFLQRQRPALQAAALSARADDATAPLLAFLIRLQQNTPWAVSEWVAVQAPEALGFIATGELQQPSLLWVMPLASSSATASGASCPTAEQRRRGGVETDGSAALRSGLGTGSEGDGVRAIRLGECSCWARTGSEGTLICRRFGAFGRGKQQRVRDAGGGRCEGRRRGAVRSWQGASGAQVHGVISFATSGDEMPRWCIRWQVGADPASGAGGDGDILGHSAERGKARIITPERVDPAALPFKDHDVAGEAGGDLLLAEKSTPSKAANQIPRTTKNRGGATEHMGIVTIDAPSRAVCWGPRRVAAGGPKAIGGADGQVLSSVDDGLAFDGIDDCPRPRTGCGRWVRGSADRGGRVAGADAQDTARGCGVFAGGAAAASCAPAVGTGGVGSVERGGAGGRRRPALAVLFGAGPPGPIQYGAGPGGPLPG
ncbi:hypothetical protein Emed_007626 [Eimeria media]